MRTILVMFVLFFISGNGFAQMGKKDKPGSEIFGPLLLEDMKDKTRFQFTGTAKEDFGWRQERLLSFRQGESRMSGTVWMITFTRTTRSDSEKPIPLEPGERYGAYKGYYRIEIDRVDEDLYHVFIGMVKGFGVQTVANKEEKFKWEHIDGFKPIGIAVDLATGDGIVRTKEIRLKTRGEFFLDVEKIRKGEAKSSDIPISDKRPGYLESGGLFIGPGDSLTERKRLTPYDFDLTPFKLSNKGTEWHNKIARNLPPGWVDREP